MPTLPEPDAPEAPRDWVDRFILPFVREPTLWPVLIVLVVHAAAFVGPLLIFAVRDDGVGSAVLLVGLGVLSLGVVRFEWRKERHLAALTGVLAATWALSALLAWLGDHTGIF